MIYAEIDNEIAAGEMLLISCGIAHVLRYVVVTVSSDELPDTESGIAQGFSARCPKKAFELQSLELSTSMNRRLYSNTDNSRRP